MRCPLILRIVSLFILGSVACADAVVLPAPYLEAQPLSLRQAEQVALTHNKSLGSQRELSKQGGYLQRQGVARWLPGSTYSAQVSRVPKAGLGASGNGTSLSGTLGFSQLIFSWDAYYGLKSAVTQKKQFQNDFSLATNDLLFQVRSAYYRVVLSDNQVEVEQENIGTLQEAYEREKRRLEAGESTKFEVHQSQVKVTEAWSGYYRAVKEARIARNQLLLLMGMDPGQEFSIFDHKIPVREVELIGGKIEKLEKLSPEAFGPLFTSSEVQQWTRTALLHRPEVNRQRISSELARREHRRSRGEYMPTITGYADDRNITTAGSSFLGQSSYWDIGIRLNWTLFDGMGRENRIRAQKARRRSAEINHEKSIQDTKGIVWDHFYKIEEALLGYTAAGQGVSLAEEALRLAKSRRDVGVITPLEYRDTVQALTVARQSFHQKSFDLLSSYYALRKDSGIDIQDRNKL